MSASPAVSAHSSCACGYISSLCVPVSVCLRTPCVSGCGCPCGDMCMCTGTRSVSVSRVRGPGRARGSRSAPAADAATPPCTGRGGGSAPSAAGQTHAQTHGHTERHTDGGTRTPPRPVPSRRPWAAPRRRPRLLLPPPPPRPHKRRRGGPGREGQPGRPGRRTMPRRGGLPAPAAARRPPPLLLLRLLLLAAPLQPGRGKGRSAPAAPGPANAAPEGGLSPTPASVLSGTVWVLSSSRPPFPGATPGARFAVPAAGGTRVPVVPAVPVPGAGHCRRGSPRIPARPGPLPPCPHLRAPGTALRQRCGARTASAGCYTFALKSTELLFICLALYVYS